ncbi:hypothetical protein CLG96_09520 [Sphingomonas oleivorans]|uniref:DUF1178 domain-containing protein n=1 Tax=Sphingomonas oleivorans TaxID=1735121 RepID=A0A2T5FYP9_9SPHN|nr:DUF1178 family protein [Sphingomonas oleivorans]PTQ11642.1 hypothetical protein CLG96_09520 [Sphingomonas oleivorans]
MIVFDLLCGKAGHIFEAWFGSSEDYEAQRARGLVSCPICGAGEVSKAVMAPNVAPKGNSGPVSGGPVAMSNEAPSPEMVKAMLSALAKVQEKMLEGSEHVGRRFAEEVRAIHLGESEQRSIHGEATADEARALIDEGISVAPLPLPVRPTRLDN